METVFASFINHPAFLPNLFGVAFLLAAGVRIFLAFRPAKGPMSHITGYYWRCYDRNEHGIYFGRADEEVPYCYGNGVRSGMSLDIEVPLQTYSEIKKGSVVKVVAWEGKEGENPPAPLYKLFWGPVYLKPLRFGHLFGW